MKILPHLRVALVNIVILLLLVEGVSWAYVTLARPDTGYLAGWPTYLDIGSEDSYAPVYDPLGPHVIDTAYPWSTWHPRNSVFRHRKPCFDVLMRFNAEGTRGRLPDPADSNTVLFVGDSFTEGYGLPEDSTLAALYGRSTGVPVLNLGSSGYVGTTQYSLIYDHFAPRYRHRRVFVVLYLANDFLENDIGRYAANFARDRRYRPYRADTADLGGIVYKGTPDSSRYSWASYREARAGGSGPLVRMGMRSYWANVQGGILSKLFHLTYASRVVRVVSKGMQQTVPEELQHGERDLRILAYDIRRIQEAAERQGATVTFLNLPGLNLMLQAGRDPQVERDYLALEARVAAMVGPGPHRFLSYFRHLRGSGVDPRGLVFACDAHYNPGGMARLADFLRAAR
jgi:hypothetical protein